MKKVSQKRGSHWVLHSIVSFRDNWFTTLLYVTALPAHIQSCYNVSFLGQESLKTIVSKATE